MSLGKCFARFLSWVIAVAALGFLFASEALAVCCKTSSGCGCTASLSCPFGQTKVSSCSTSGGALTLNGSTISCLYGAALGSVSTDRGSEAGNLPAIWTETGRVTCTNSDASGAATVDLSVEYKMAGSCVNADADSGYGNGCLKFVDPDNTGTGPKKGGGTSTNISQARCEVSSITGKPHDELVYAAFCGPGVTVKGTLKAVGDPPLWVENMCTGSNGSLQDCTTTPNGFLLVLGGFETDKRGNVIQTKCVTDFPNQVSDGGLPAGKVLHYVERYAANSGCTGPRLDAGDGQRRMCQDHTFYNPNYNETTGTGATNPPCAPSGGVTFRAGILATDEANITAAPLYDNQWRPDSTLNISCTNNGTNPTTIVNSENFAASSFQFMDGPIEAYVTGGNPEDVSPATSATPILDSTTGVPIGLKVHFADCGGVPGGNGLDQVICRNINFASNPQSVNLTIRGERADGLGFIGNATGININNAAANCPSIQ